MRGGGGGGWGGREMDETPYVPPPTDGSAPAPPPTDPARPYSTRADQTFAQNHTLAESMNPLNRTIHSNAPANVVVCLDVSGSMQDWPKVVWDKLPMFFGQLTMPETNYLPGVALSFCFFADVLDKATTLQITDFCQGSMIDGEISVACLGGGRGPGDGEAYDLPVYFYGSPAHCVLSSPRERNFFFMIGDEKHYDAAMPEYVHKFIGDRIDHPIPVPELFSRLNQRFQTYFLHKRLVDGTQPTGKTQAWQHDCYALWDSTLGVEHHALLDEPKAVIDMMLGIVAVASGARTPDQYISDLRTRGQSVTRQAQIRAAFAGMGMYGPELRRQPVVAHAPRRTPSPKHSPRRHHRHH